MGNLWNRIQSPQTTFGKSLRDAAIFGAVGGVILFLQTVDAVDFGQYDVIASTIIGFLVTALNRVTRK